MEKVTLDYSPLFAAQVCQGDRIVVTVENHLPGEATTIHWHGIHQVKANRIMFLS